MTKTQRTVITLALSLFVGLIWAATVIATTGSTSTARLGTARNALTITRSRNPDDALSAAARVLAGTSRRCIE
jgi:hypothetical protein